jgi:hypothetical protein
MDEWNRNRRFQSDYDDFKPDQDDRKGRRRREQDAHRKEQLDHELDRGLEDTFPGSDPVSVIQPTGGKPKR